MAGNRRLPTGFVRQSIIECLEEEDLTTKALAQELEMSTSNVMWHLRALRAERRVRVAAWTKSGTTTTPIWGLGSKPDEPRPPKMTQSEAAKRYREKYSALLKLKRREQRGEQLNVFTKIMPIDRRGVSDEYR